MDRIGCLLLAAVASCTTSHEIRGRLTPEQIDAFNAQLRGKDVEIVHAALVATRSSGDPALDPAETAWKDETSQSRNVVINRPYELATNVTLGLAETGWTDETSQPRTVPTSALRSVRWLSAGRPRALGAVQGAGLGFLAGVTGGTLIGYAVTNPKSFGGRDLGASVGGAFCAVAGLAVGTLIGATLGHRDELTFVPERKAQ